LTDSSQPLEYGGSTPFVPAGLDRPLLVNASDDFYWQSQRKRRIELRPEKRRQAAAVQNTVTITSCTPDRIDADDQSCQARSNAVLSIAGSLPIPVHRFNQRFDVLEGGVVLDLDVENAAALQAVIAVGIMADSGLNLGGCALWNQPLPVGVNIDDHRVFAAFLDIRRVSLEQLDLRP